MTHGQQGLSVRRTQTRRYLALENWIIFTPWAINWGPNRLLLRFKLSWCKHWNVCHINKVSRNIQLLPVVSITKNYFKVANFKIDGEGKFSCVECLTSDWVFFFYYFGFFYWSVWNARRLIRCVYLIIIFFFFLLVGVECLAVFFYDFCSFLLVSVEC